MRNHPQKVYPLQIFQNLNVCDIFKIRNPKCQNFTFRHNYSTRFIERRLDYISISNCFQEFVTYTNVLHALSNDNSPVLTLLSNDNFDNNGHDLCKFNSSLVHHEVFVENMKEIITKIYTSNEFIKDAQTKWEFL